MSFQFRGRVWWPLIVGMLVVFGLVAAANRIVCFPHSISGTLAYLALCGFAGNGMADIALDIEARALERRVGR